MSKAKTVVGEIYISHGVTCPHCNRTMFDDGDDRDWWEEQITDQLPDDEHYKMDYDVECKHCNKPFKINGFIY